jgi:hypothetical protein
MSHSPQALNPNPYGLKKRMQRIVACNDGKDLMVKMGTLVRKFETAFFGINSLKMVKQITSSKKCPNLPLNSNLFP